MKNLAELSQSDELIMRLKEIAAHVLSTDNMRLVTCLCDISSFYETVYFKFFRISPHLVEHCMPMPFMW